MKNFNNILLNIIVLPLVFLVITGLTSSKFTALNPDCTVNSLVWEDGNDINLGSVTLQCGGLYDMHITQYWEVLDNIDSGQFDDYYSSDNDVYTLNPIPNTYSSGDVVALETRHKVGQTFVKWSYDNTILD
ncbi:MAG: hypothetical protein WD529_01320 [Balneolaceae bacterium]